MSLNEGHGHNNKVCHKILFKAIIIIIITGKNFRILVLVEIIVGNNPTKVGNNLSKVGSNLKKVDNNLSRVGSNLNRVGNTLRIEIPNLVSKPYCHHLKKKL